MHALPQVPNMTNYERLCRLILRLKKGSYVCLARPKNILKYMFQFLWTCYKQSNKKNHKTMALQNPIYVE
jgi:hypothetical protein